MGGVSMRCAINHRRYLKTTVRSRIVQHGIDPITTGGTQELTVVCHGAQSGNLTSMGYGVVWEK